MRARDKETAEGYEENVAAALNNNQRMRTGMEDGVNGPDWSEGSEGNDS